MKKLKISSSTLAQLENLEKVTGGVGNGVANIGGMATVSQTSIYTTALDTPCGALKSRMCS